MIQINLLPWRDKRRKKILNVFYRNTGVACLIAIIVLVAMHQHYNSVLRKQQHRLDVINLEISSESKDVDRLKAEIKKSEQAYNQLKVIIKLKKQSFLPVRMLDEMTKVVPDGVNILTLSFEGQQVSLLGETSSNTMITQLMRNIKASKFFLNPNLSGFSVSSQVSASTRTFRITFDLLGGGE